MTTVAQPHGRRRWWVRLLLFPFLGLMLLFVLWVIATWDFPPLLVVFALLFGWLHLASAAVAAAQLNWNLVAEAAICVTIMAAGSHWFLAWLFRASGSGEQRVWRIRWTGAGMGIVMLMFVIGISIVGITHQTAWLLSSGKTLLRTNWDGIYVGHEAIQLSEYPRDEIARFYSDSKHMPESTDEVFHIPVVPLGGHYVHSMTVHSGGRVRFQLDQSRTDGEIFELYPVPNEKGDIRWMCTGTFKRLPHCTE